MLGVNTVSRALVAALCDPDRAAPPPRVMDLAVLRSGRLYDGDALRPSAWPGVAPEPAATLEEALP